MTAVCFVMTAVMMLLCFVMSLNSVRLFCDKQFFRFRVVAFSDDRQRKTAKAHKSCFDSNNSAPVHRTQTCATPQVVSLVFVESSCVGLVEQVDFGSNESATLIFRFGTRHVLETGNSNSKLAMMVGHFFLLAAAVGRNSGPWEIHR